MVDNDFAEFLVSPTQSIIIEGNLNILVGTRNHQLNRVTIPCTVRGIFVIFIRHHKTEVDIVIIITNLNCGGLVIRSCP